MEIVRLTDREHERLRDLALEIHNDSFYLSDHVDGRSGKSNIIADLRSLRIHVDKALAALGVDPQKGRRR